MKGFWNGVRPGVAFLVGLMIGIGIYGYAAAFLKTRENKGCVEYVNELIQKAEREAKP